MTAMRLSKYSIGIIVSVIFLKVALFIFIHSLRFGSFLIRLGFVFRSNFFSIQLAFQNIAAIAVSSFAFCASELRDTAAHKDDCRFATFLPQYLLFPHSEKWHGVQSIHHIM